MLKMCQLYILDNFTNVMYVEMYKVAISWVFMDLGLFSLINSENLKDPFSLVELYI